MRLVISILIVWFAWAYVAWGCWYVWCELVDWWRDRHQPENVVRLDDYRAYREQPRRVA